jgi:hypothetical protein
LSHPALCDNRDSEECGEACSEDGIQGARYKCANCANFDYCSACFQRWITAPSEKQRKVATAAGHASTHLFLYLPFANDPEDYDEDDHEHGSDCGCGHEQVNDLD